MRKLESTLKDELIEDRELPTALEDQLGHQLIAQQLADLVRSIPAPSNVALFGPWGSGKSSIANLFKAEISKMPGIKYARFDAFKYAENPLRRNFVSATALALNIDKKKYREELYNDKTHTDFDIPFVKILRLAWIFAIILSGCSVIALTICAIVSAFSDQGFWSSFLALARSAAINALLPASLLTALVAFVGKTFVVEKKIQRAESDEQFELLFGELVVDSNADRVVIFVDELDRCAPAEVVSTLDAIRTFLGVPKCIFIVAADQQALEQALSESVKQATPADSLNPYYSSGSAYLDKVFQYQISIPPLLPQKVSQFAANLVRSKGGLWARIDIDLVVSILVPSHVRSPRRVKNLLNTFALFCKHAEQRAKENQLDLDIFNRIDEIAKLVCLRVEFPLFARDLVVDARLPEYVLRLFESRNSEEVWADFEYVTADAQEIARRYAKLEARVDYLLTDDESPNQANDDVEHETESLSNIVTQQHGKQLIDYLSRTRSVVGPKRDIIHLQSTGNLFGLETAFAEFLEQSAQDGALQRIGDRVETLTGDEQGAVISFLTQQARSAIGVEASNVARTLLFVSGKKAVKLHDHASSAIEAISSVIVKSPNIVDSMTITGAWRLASASDRPAALRLRTSILDSQEMATNPAVSTPIFADTKTLFAQNRHQAAIFVLTKVISTTPNEWYTCVQSVAREYIPELVEALASIGLPKRIKAICAEHDKWARPAPRGTTATAPSEKGPEPPTGKEGIDFLERWVLELAESDQAAAESVLSLLLQIAHTLSREATGRCLRALKPVESAGCAARIISQMTWLDVQDWPRWMQSVAASSLHGEEVVKALQMAVSDLWTFGRDTEHEEEFGEIEDAADALAITLDRLPVNDRQRITFSPSDSDGKVVSADDITKHEQLRRTLDVFLRNGIFSLPEVAGIELTSLVNTFAADVVPDDNLIRHVVMSCERVLARYEQSSITDGASAQAVARLDEAIAKCDWLPSIDKLSLRLHCWSIRGVAESDREDFPNTQELLDVLQQSAITDIRPVVYWLKATSHTEQELSHIIKAYAASSSEELSAELARCVSNLSHEEQAHLLRELFEKPEEESPSATIVRAVVTAPTSAELPAILTSRFEAATNNSQRRSALAIWVSTGVLDASSRRIAIHKVLMPMFTKNRQALDIALDYLKYFAPVPNELRPDVAAAIAKTADGDDRLERKALAVLKSVGFSTRKQGIIGFRREVVDE